MSGNTFGRSFCVTTFGESHGPAIGAVVDGCPPGLELSEADLQPDLELRRTGTSRHTSQRQEPDRVRILSGVFEGRTTGAAIGLVVDNVDARSRDYGKIKDRFRPGHADYAYQQKYGFRDYRGGGRASARITVATVAAGAIARKYLRERLGRKQWTDRDLRLHLVHLAAEGLMWQELFQMYSMPGPARARLVALMEELARQWGAGQAPKKIAKEA